MKNILYIGNKLQQTNKTVTSIDTLSKNLQKESYHVVSASSKTNKVFKLLDMLYHIIKYRKTTDYVLIDTYSTLNFYYAHLCSKLCRLLKLKYLPILHGGNLPRRLKSSPKISKAVFKNAHVNITPSKYLMSYFEKAGYKNLKHIPNAIEIDNYTFEQRRIDNIKLLWVRSFSNIYHPELAVKVAKALKDEGLINVELCMVGPNKDESLTKTRALAKELDINVKFTGKLSKQAWIELSKDYNIFINTTNVDNTPVSVIEAMALGLPVVSTNVGGMPFLIDNNIDGILVEPNSVKGFVNAIKYLQKKQNKTNEMTYSARKKIEQFDWEIVKNQWSKLLK